MFFNSLRHQRQVVVKRGDDERLLNLQIRRRCVVADAVDVLMTRSQSVGSDLMHRFRHRGGEQQRLSLRRQIRQNFFQARSETHVEKLIRLVEHQDVEVLARARQVARLKVIDQTSGSSDQKFNPLRRQSLSFAVNVRPTEDNLAIERMIRQQTLRLLADLRRQLSRRRNYQARHVPLSRRSLFCQPFDRR